MIKTAIHLFLAIDKLETIVGYPSVKFQICSEDLLFSF